MLKNVRHITSLDELRLYDYNAQLQPYVVLIPREYVDKLDYSYLIPIVFCHPEVVLAVLTQWEDNPEV